jgi:hypothetical protein
LIYNFIDCKNILLLFVSILPIIILFSINNIDDAHGQNNGTTTQTLVQQNPGSIELQPPIDAQTGQTIKLRGTAVTIKDPVTGQLVVEEIKLQPPEVTGPSLSSTVNQEPLLDANLGLLSTAPNSPIGNPNAAFGLTTTGQSSGIGALGSTVNPTLATSADAGPTFNPPLKNCATSPAGTSKGGFDLAKYAFTGNLNKDRLKGDEFAFQIFADLVANDGVEIKGDDAPYKANMLTDLKDHDRDEIDKVDVKLDEIATVCIDTQHAINTQNIEEIDLERSLLFKELNY